MCCDLIAKSGSRIPRRAVLAARIDPPLPHASCLDLQSGFTTLDVYDKYWLLQFIAYCLMLRLLMTFWNVLYPSWAYRNTGRNCGVRVIVFLVRNLGMISPDYYTINYYFYLLIMWSCLRGQHARDRKTTCRRSLSRPVYTVVDAPRMTHATSEFIYHWP